MAQLWHPENSALGTEFLEHCSWATLRLPVDALDSAVFIWDEGSTCALVESLSFSNLWEDFQRGCNGEIEISQNCRLLAFLL